MKFLKKEDLGIPSNVVVVNGQEFIVPDSWMPVLWAYLQLMQCQIGQPNPNYGKQVEATQPEPFSLLKHRCIQPLGKEIGKAMSKIVDKRPLDNGDCDTE